MDIDLLSKMVKELILDRDEVTLPGVGTFVAETVPASFSDRGYTINPPYRRLSFRQRRDTVDDSLVRMYARINAIDVEKAERVVAEFLVGMKDVLIQKKIIVFPGLGRLRATKENNFFFVADEDLDIYPGGFGLEPVSLKTHQESADEISAAVKGLEEEMTGQAGHDGEEQEEATPEEEEIFHVVPAEEEMTDQVGHDDEDALGHDDEDALDHDDENVLDHDEETTPCHLEQSREVSSESEAETEISPLAALGRNDKGESAQDDKESEPKARRPMWVKILLWVLVAAVIAVVLFAVAARLFPDFFDSILYSAEELEILEY